MARAKSAPRMKTPEEVYAALLEELGYVPKWKYAPGEEIRQHAQAIPGRRGGHELGVVAHRDVPAPRQDVDRGVGQRAVVHRDLVEHRGLGKPVVIVGHPVGRADGAGWSCAGTAPSASV